jgi:hypothetical protein
MLKVSTCQYNIVTIFYNFIRKHQAIGMTPAQASGIEYDLGTDKWIGLIRKATQTDA